MYKFSRKSREKLAQCHPDLQKIFNEAIEIIDLTITEGIRSVEKQEEYFRTGMSQTMHSKHLEQDDGFSHATDAAPYPIDYEDKLRFAYYQGIIQGISHILHKNGETTHKVKSGIDWDGDGNIKEHSLFDGPHVELEDE